MNIWQKLKKPFFVLAPMDDVTDTVFRRIVAEAAAPDLYFTEFANADGLQSPGRKAVMEKLQFTELETPLIAQIWGMDPENYYKTAREIVSILPTETAQSDDDKEKTRRGERRTRQVRRMSTDVSDEVSAESASREAGSARLQASAVSGFRRGFAGIDINMGCPVPKVVKLGACSAMINNRPLAQEIIAATKEGTGGRVPVSVKTRPGFNQVDLDWTQFLLEQNIAALAVHGRTSKQQSKVPNDWDLIGEIRAQRDAIAPSTVFIGNGDVESRQQGIKLAEHYQLDGIMVGRGIFKDPYVFAQESPWHGKASNEKVELYKKHIRLFEKTWGGQRNPASLKKFAKVYVSGFDGASDLRSDLMQASTTSDLLKTLENY